ncbi:RHS repeat-associated core domain-containing protein [Pseudomonas hunanensis]|uniref:RHS repeat-associated core domain-containing protein n=1 Tax=Pseudomonas hunanensis TaxID=1247546 RepID=UPI002406D0EE|nr:RHS repeat-associated core domain-containing protein [Pseudomonas hunanensis]MDF9753835.1 RHS repeat-associated protein [Pseudomonas hunanensis]
MTGVWQVTKKHAPYTKDSIFALGSPPHTRRYALAQSKLLATDLSKSILLTAQGAVQQNNAYSPYGELRPGCARNLLAYNGEYMEQAGLYLLGHGNRVYSPRLMRFLSPDRIGVFLQQNYNAYAYCNGDPVNYSDPSGNLRSLKQLALDTILTSHADSSIAVAEIAKKRLDARTTEIGKLSRKLTSIEDSKKELADILSISIQHQTKKITSQTAGKSLQQLLPFTGLNGDAHRKILSLSPEDINKHIETIKNKILEAKKIRQEIADLQPLLEIEAIVYLDAVRTAQEAVNAIDRQYWKSGYENYRIRE